MIRPRPAGKRSAESAQKETLLRAEYVLPSAEQTWSPRARQVGGVREAAPRASITDAPSSTHTQDLMEKDQRVSPGGAPTRAGERGGGGSVRHWGGFLLGLTAGAAMGVALAQMSSASSRQPVGVWPWWLSGPGGALAYGNGQRGRARQSLSSGVQASRSSGLWALQLLAALAKGVLEVRRECSK